MDSRRPVPGQRIFDAVVGVAALEAENQRLREENERLMKDLVDIALKALEIAERQAKRAGND